MRKHKQVISSKLRWVEDLDENENEKDKEEVYNRESVVISANGNGFILHKDICSNHYFQIMQNISKHSISASSDYSHRVIGLEAKLAKMDYVLIEPEDKR